MDRHSRPRHFPDFTGAPERREQVIATGRVFLAGGALLSAYLGPIRPVQNAALISGMMIGYLALSLFLWLALRWWPTADPAVCIGAHAADLFCTTALTVLSRGPSSPFFLFFMFVLLAAAYRWGLKGTMLTAGAGVGLLAGEAYVLAPTGLPSRMLHGAGVRVAQEFGISEMVLRCVYLLLIGLLLGYLAEGEKALQSEAATAAHIVGKAQVGGGLKATLEGMLEGILAAFGSGRGAIVAEEIDSGRVYLWEARRPTDGSRLDLSMRLLEQNEWSSYRRAGDAGAWFAWKTRAGDYRMAEARSERTSQPARPAGSQIPDGLRHSGTVMAAPFQWGMQWQGWIYVFGGNASLRWRRELGFLQRIVDAASPAAYNAYLLSRMRSQIGAQERGRVARELHDGPIQSLVAAELQMHVMRGQAAAGSLERADQLDQLEQLVHDQVLNLRDLMEKIRPIDPDPRHLPEFFAEQVEKFQRETGIEASFAATGGQLLLSGRTSRELIHIAQELLFNVRRHSGARRVEVRLDSHNGTCQLEVADDGQGFEFAGRFSLAELEAMRKGPRVVQERVRVLGGNLEIESQPGKGARLQVTVPQRKV